MEGKGRSDAVQKECKRKGDGGRRLMNRAGYAREKKKVEQWENDRGERSRERLCGGCIARRIAREEERGYNMSDGWGGKESEDSRSE